MSRISPSDQPKLSARDKTLAAALTVIRTKGYAPTTVDDLCAAAGVTKGAFFTAAPYHTHSDPLARLLGYIAFRKALLTGALPEFTCLAGTMVQEIYDSIPAIRDACSASVRDHAANVETDIAAAIQQRGMRPSWTAKSLALHTQAVLQGAFILAKATGGAEIAAESVDHLRRYVECLFNATHQKDS